MGACYILSTTNLESEVNHAMDRSRPLYDSARTIAEEMATEATESLDLPALVEEVRFRDARQALVVGYHELMWDVMDHFEAMSLVHKPRAFAEPDRTEPSDIADLVFLVRASR